MSAFPWMCLLVSLGICASDAQEYYVRGSVELELHRSEDGTRASATFTQREGTLPAARFATAVPLTLRGEEGEYKGERALSIKAHFHGETVDVSASGPLRTGKSAETLDGSYRRIATDDRLAAEKARAARIDAELNRVYGDLKPKLKPAQFEELRDAQREWIRYTYESSGVAAEPGTDAEAWRSRADHAAERIQFLKNYAPGRSNEDTPDLRGQLDAAIEAQAWASAAEIARRILVISPRDTAVWEKRAQALVEEKDWDRCAAVLDDWAKSPAGKPAIMDAFRGDVALGQEQDEEAARAWASYLKAAAKDIPYRMRLAALYVKLENWTEAVKVLEQRLKLKVDAEAYSRLAFCEAMLRDWKKAGSAIRQGSAVDATDDEVKRILPRVERLEKAMADIRGADKSVAAAPRDPAPVLDRGLLFARLGWPELALQEANAALRIASESRRALLQKAAAVRGSSRADVVKELKERGVDTSPAVWAGDGLLREIGRADAQVATASGEAAGWARRATLLNRATQPKLALPDAEAALKLNGNSDEGLVARSRATLALGRDWEALPDAVRATEINPQNALAWLTRGEIDTKHYEFAKAVESLSKAIDLESRNKSALQLRQRCYRALGKNTEAELDAFSLKTL